MATTITQSPPTPEPLWRLAARNGEIVSEPEKTPEPKPDLNSWEALYLRLDEARTPIVEELFERLDLDGLSERDEVAILVALEKVLFAGARAGRTHCMEVTVSLGFSVKEGVPWGIEVIDEWTTKYGGKSKSTAAERGDE